MKLARYMLVGVMQLVLACGGIVFVEPFCSQCDYDAAPVDVHEAQPVVKEDASHHVPDAMRPICPKAGAYCDPQDNNPLWCLDDEFAFNCNATHEWGTLDCLVLSVDYGACRKGLCVAQTCP